MLTVTYIVASRDVTPLLPMVQIAELKVLLEVKNLIANENTFHKTAWSHIIKPDPKFLARNPPGMNSVVPRCHLAHLGGGSSFYVRGGSHRVRWGFTLSKVGVHIRHIITKGVGGMPPWKKN